MQKVKCRYINTNTISIFMDFYTIISNSGDDEVGELSCSCLREPQTSTIQDFNSETFEYQHHPIFDFANFVLTGSRHGSGFVGP